MRFSNATNLNRKSGGASGTVVAHLGMGGEGWTESAQQQPTRFPLHALETLRQVDRRDPFPLPVS